MRWTRAAHSTGSSAATASNPWFISDEAIWMAIRETGCLGHHERDRAVLVRDYLGLATEPSQSTVPHEGNEQGRAPCPIEPPAATAARRRRHT
jgi:hypothetical protein